MWYEAEGEDDYIRDVCLFNSEKDNGDNSVVLIDYDNGCKVAYCECFFSATGGRRFTMIGDRAELIGGSDTNEITVTRRFTREKAVYTPGAAVGGHGGGDPRQMAEFLDALQDGRPSKASGEAGLISMAIGQAAEISAEEGRFVEISELLGD